MENERARPGTISVIIQSANPIFIFAAVFIPTGALIYAMNFGTVTILNYVHIMTGALWTGIDLFMGFVLGPVLGTLDPQARAAVFRRLIPKMTFLMPVLATVTITAGMQLAERIGLLSFSDLFGALSNPWLLAAAIIAALLTVQGFGIMLPNEVRVFKQLVSETPDIDKISRLGMRNARLGGIQGLFQLAIIFIMANIRF